MENYEKIIEVKTMAEYQKALMNVKKHKIEKAKKGEKCKTCVFEKKDEYKLCKYCVEQEDYLFEFEQNNTHLFIYLAIYYEKTPQRKLYKTSKEISKSRTPIF